MDITITAANIRGMVQRLRKSVDTSLTQSKAYEALSEVLVGKNWDTFSAILKRESTSAVPLRKPVTMFISAFSTSEFGESPDWVEILVDEAFLCRITDMQALCRSHEFDHVAEDNSPVVWHDNLDEPLNVRSSKLYVTADSWWYHGKPKHADYAVESHLIYTARLISLLRGELGDSNLQWRKDVLIYNDDGDIEDAVEALVEAGRLDESYLMD